MSDVIESELDPSKKQRSKRGTAVTLDQWAMPSSASDKEMIPEFSQLQAHQKKIVEQEVLKACRWNCCYMVFFLILAIGLHAGGMYTTQWYSFSVSDKSVTASGDTLVRKQTFGIYLRGLTLFQEFCDTISGQCITNIDQTRFFDDSLNPQSIKWAKIKYSKEYAEPVAKARAIEELSFKMAKVCWVFFLFSFIPVLARTVPIGWECCHWSELMYSGAALINVIALLILYISIGLIDTELEELRLATAKYPLITVASNKAIIEFKWGSSFWLAVSCTIPYTICLYIIWRSFPVDPELDVTSQKAKDRAKRTSAYLSDVSNTSHMVESRPQDTVNAMFHSNIKMGGWTSKVESVPLNDFTLGLNKSPPEVLRHSAKIAVMAADDGPINDIKVPQAEAEFSGTLEWQTDSKRRRASAKEKSPAKKERRSTLSEANLPPPPPQGQARPKGRRNTMSEGVPPAPVEPPALPGMTIGVPTMGSVPARVGPHVGVLPSHPSRSRRGSVSEIQTRERKVTRAPRPPKQLPSSTRPLTPPRERAQALSP